MRNYYDRTRGIVDMSSIMWTCLLVGNDVDAVTVDHNERRVNVNSAEYGYENAVNSLVAFMDRFSLTPKDLVLVFEGRDSKRRRCMIDATYKANREGPKDSRPPQAYEQFNRLKEMLKQTFRDLGAVAVSQPFVEGDDVIAYMVQNAEEDTVVHTFDNDLVVLNGVNEYGSTCMVHIQGEVGVNKYGKFDFKLVELYKSLVGDSSDNVKGCPGFGPKAWESLLAEYGQDGAYELMALIQQGKRDSVSEFAEANNCKLLRKIVMEWDTTYKSNRLVQLHPEWVDTRKNALEWEAGLVKKGNQDERLRGWAAASRLVTADNYTQALSFLKAKLAESPYVGFDIETSTPIESSDWLLEQGDPQGVDVIGSYLVGFSITFGSNNQYTYYVSVKHANSSNITMVQAREMIAECFGKHLIIANTSFELSVLYNAEDEDGTLWRDKWAHAGARGFLPNVLDIQLEASYVNENKPLGLKFRTEHHLGYLQETFDEVTLLEGKPFDGGQPAGETHTRYKMHELPAAHVFSYGADDATCTSALHNFYHWHMQMDRHYHVYLDVEIDALYQHAQNFVQGTPVDVAKLKALDAEDQEVYDKAWASLCEYLRKVEWEGTVTPVYDVGISAKQIKDAYQIVTGITADEPDEDDEDAEVEVVKDPVLASRVRTPAKLAALIEAQGYEELAYAVSLAVQGLPDKLNELVAAKFTGEPRFKSSNKQMTKLLYDVMGLPIRVRGKPTATMKAKGIREGNPKGDALAIAYAMRDADDDLKQVLEAIKLLQMVKTRQGLYYTKYPLFVHWKTGKIHSSHRQCATNTRRASSAKPNLQQMPKHPKIEGYASKFREVIVPHRSDAVIVSMDFAAQELRVIAHYSQDRNMLACYIGENKKDMHCLTGASIMHKSEKRLFDSYLETLPNLPADMDEAEYQVFCSLETGDATQKANYKLYRSLGKKVNFTTEFGAQKTKLAMTLLIEEDEAQKYIDAKESKFKGVVKWKEDVIEEAGKAGYVRTMLGAKRHLSELLESEDRYIASKADRQSVNFKVQGSSAEMTKKAEGRMWAQGVFADPVKARCIGPIHDEVVASVRISDLQEILPMMHACMVGGYADMTVPIESSISFGKDFSNQIEIGNTPSAEAIAEGMKELDGLV